MNDGTKIGLIIICWVLAGATGYILGWHKGYNDADKDRDLVDSITKHPPKKNKNAIDPKKLSYRVIERDIHGETKWVPQYRTWKGEWVDCCDRNGPIIRDRASWARHWLFWEGGSKQFPDAGNGDQMVYIYRKDGTRIPEEDE